MFDVSRGRSGGGSTGRGGVAGGGGRWIDGAYLCARVIFGVSKGLWNGDGRVNVWIVHVARKNVSTSFPIGDNQINGVGTGYNSGWPFK